MVYLKSKRPLMSKVKEVVEYTVGAKRVVSSADVLEALKYDLSTDARLLEELRLHPQIKVTEPGGGGDAPGDRLVLLSYVSTFDVRSRAELLQALERLPEGIAVKVSRPRARPSPPVCSGMFRRAAVMAAAAGGFRTNGRKRPPPSRTRPAVGRAHAREPSAPPHTHTRTSSGRTRT